MRFALLLLPALMGLQEPAGTPVWWSLKKGQKIRYEFNHRLLSGLKDSVKQTDLTIVVGLEGGDLGADRTNAITLTFERFALVKSGEGESVDYDSARDKEPPADPYARILSKCVGKSISFRIAATGRFSIVDELAKMILEAAGAWPELKGRTRWQSAGAKKSAKKLEFILRVGLETPKGGPAAVGDAWETKFEDEDVSEGVARAVCLAKLKEVKAGVAQIDQKVTFEFDPNYAKIVKEASGKGALAWDTERGMLKTLGMTAKITHIWGELTYSVTVALLPDAK